MARRRAQQTSLRFSRRGGPRPGAGRPKKPGAKLRHAVRTLLASRHPVHVTLRALPGVPNHLHLLVEASSASALSRGIQGLSIRIARGVNRAAGRRGKLSADRFHARALNTPREVRIALVYVLQN